MGAHLVNSASEQSSQLQACFAPGGEQHSSHAPQMQSDSHLVRATPVATSFAEAQAASSPTAVAHAVLGPAGNDTECSRVGGAAWAAPARTCGARRSRKYNRLRAATCNILRACTRFRQKCAAPKGDGERSTANPPCAVQLLLDYALQLASSEGACTPALPSRSSKLCRGHGRGSRKGGSAANAVQVSQPTSSEAPRPAHSFSAPCAHSSSAIDTTQCNDAANAAQSTPDKRGAQASCRRDARSASEQRTSHCMCNDARSDAHIQANSNARMERSVLLMTGSGTSGSPEAKFLTQPALEHSQPSVSPRLSSINSSKAPSVDESESTRRRLPTLHSRGPATAEEAELHNPQPILAPAAAIEAGMQCAFRPQGDKHAGSCESCSPAVAATHSDYPVAPPDGEHDSHSLQSDIVGGPAADTDFAPVLVCSGRAKGAPSLRGECTIAVPRAADPTWQAGVGIGFVSGSVPLRVGCARWCTSRGMCKQGRNATRSRRNNHATTSSESIPIGCSAVVTGPAVDSSAQSKRVRAAATNAIPAEGPGAQGGTASASSGTIEDGACSQAACALAATPAGSQRRHAHAPSTQLRRRGNDNVALEGSERPSSAQRAARVSKTKPWAGVGHQSGAAIVLGPFGASAGFVGAATADEVVRKVSGAADSLTTADSPGLHVLMAGTNTSRPRSAQRALLAKKR